MDRGYIKLWRKIQDSKYWLKEKFTRGQAWVDLLMLANHKDGGFRVRGIWVDIKRGQVGHSEKSLAARWLWSRTKVRAFIFELEKEHQIRQEKNNVMSLITIQNYDLYQENKTPEKTAKKTPERHQKDTNNNDKNVKNIKKEAFGEFKNVFLYLTEYEKLKTSFGLSGTELRIEKLSSYIASKGKKYKSHYATILTWERKNNPALLQQSNPVTPETVEGMYANN